ncbi:uncharacterized protein loc100797370 [Stylonychia lemnae]|uniref:Uncharacterized protein loc100797370 n=1 Tax=Stylonychia lemnae TaxID=5949 RepID=A0A077ZZN0_STYLE|nr:uncharacterized protein loc100797370 [Stylonychia lemnae]|eukprot:CDW73983.1 uncharacterized protein loc100797370 [Stylonychia lemnae]
MMLMIQPRPSEFQESEKSFSVGKNGYISIDFTPMIKPQENSPYVADIQNRKNIIVTMKSVGDILDLDSRSQFDSEKDSEGFFIQYQGQNEDDPIKVLRMNKIPGEQYKFSYCEVGDDEQVGNVTSMDLTYGEVRNIQILIEYSVPLLLGWHCIYNPSVIQESSTEY